MENKELKTEKQFTEQDYQFVPEKQRAFVTRCANKVAKTSAHGTANKGSIVLKPVNRELMGMVVSKLDEKF